MLHKDPFIISSKTFKLIQELQKLPELEGFYLVGGTALALQLGHRNSIDIDLFTQKSFENNVINNCIISKYKVKDLLIRENTIITLINNIKTDFIKHDYPFILPPITEEGITMLSKEDITAMKLHAIVQSGKRLKDFIDIYYLLDHFSINQMVDFYSQKYKHSNPMIALKALNYFEDIDPDIDPPKLKVPLKLNQIKDRIQKGILKPNLIF